MGRQNDAEWKHDGFDRNVEGNEITPMNQKHWKCELNYKIAAAKAYKKCRYTCMYDRTKIQQSRSQNPETIEDILQNHAS